MGHGPAFLKIVDAARAGVEETTVEAVKARLARGEKFHLVDVREDNEWAKGRLPGAVHMGRGVIERDIEALIPDKKAEIILYCGGGFRSVLSAESLGKMGYERVISMEGGYRGWLGAGGAIEK